MRGPAAVRARGGADEAGRPVLPTMAGEVARARAAASLSLGIRPLTVASAAVFLAVILFPLSLAVSIVVGPLYIYSATALVVIGLALAPYDFWLGASVCYFAILALGLGTSVALSGATWLAVAALLLVLMRTAPIGWLRLGAALLVVMGVGQTFYALLQATGSVEPWAAAPGAIPAPMVHGTMGSPRLLGALVAMTGALGPVWLLPVAVLGLALSESWLAALALTVALAVRYRQRWRWAILAITGGTAMLGVIAILRGGQTGTVSHRADVWLLGLEHWWAGGTATWLLGYGLGGWWAQMPRIEFARWPDLREIMRSAYNEPLQVLYEGGLIGILLAGLWLWSWRRAFVAPGPFAGPLIVLAVLSLGTFPFHVPALVGPALVVIAGAQREVSGP